MRILVTGGGGFVGSHLANLLADAGHTIAILDIDESNAREISSQVQFIKGDVTDSALVTDLLRQSAFHEIVHLAGISHTVSSALGQVGALMPGTIGLATIYDAIQKLSEEGRSKLRRVSIASSSLLSGMFQRYGASGKVENDETTIDLADCYHQYVDNKLAMEMICHDNWNQFGVNFTIFRFGTTYGPRMKRNVVTWYFIRDALLGRPMKIHGDGSQRRQHFHVSDLVNGIRIILENDYFHNHTVSIVPENMTSVLDIARAVGACMPSALHYKFVPERPIDVRVRQIRFPMALGVLGWQPNITLNEGIAVTVEYYKERMHLVEDGFDDRIKEES